MSRSEAQVRAELAWWAWHDADAARWSVDQETAEARCQAWVDGEGDDGPPPIDREDEAACAADALYDSMRDAQLMAESRQLLDLGRGR